MKGLEGYDRARRHLQTIQMYYAEAKRHPTNETIASAIDLFRKEAIPFAGHHDYDPIWRLSER